MIDAGDSQVVQKSPREALFKDRYFVSGRGSGIAKRFKNPAQIKKRKDFKRTTSLLEELILIYFFCIYACLDLNHRYF